MLEALGIADRVSPATRSEIALHVVQAASYREAAAMLARRGFSCDVSSLVRISTATTEASTRLRDAALAAACVSPYPATGPWQANGCVSASTAAACASAVPIAGVRQPRAATGFQPRGVKPQLFVIDILDAQGQPQIACVYRSMMCSLETPRRFGRC